MSYTSHDCQSINLIPDCFDITGKAVSCCCCPANVSYQEAKQGYNKLLDQHHKDVSAAMCVSTQIQQDKHTDTLGHAHDLPPACLYTSVAFIQSTLQQPGCHAVNGAGRHAVDSSHNDKSGT